MLTLRSLCFPALFLTAALLFVGCDGFDSGTPPNEAASGDDGGGATVSFAGGDFSAVESQGTISLDVTITNPPNDTVTAEVLYADGASATGPSDFNLEGSEQIGQGRVAGQVVFPDTATTGNTQAIELNIQDDEPGEEREEGIFLLQNVQNAEIGESNQLAVTIGAIRVFFQDFSDGLGSFSAVSLQSARDWGTNSDAEDYPSNGQYAFVSGFQGGSGEPGDDWLISRSFNFNQLEDETLSFSNTFEFSDEIRGLRVKVSTDYNGGGDSTSVANATWTDVSDQVTFQDESFGDFLDSGDIDLSATDFQSGSTYFAFQFVSSGTDSGQTKNWLIDNVELTSSTQPPEDE